MKTLGLAMLVLLGGEWISAATVAAAEPTTQPPKKLALDLGNNVTLKLVLIPAGEFLMGSDESVADLKAAGFDFPETVTVNDEHPVHRVRLSKSFYLGQYEVTKGTFAAFVTADDYRTDAEKDGKGGWGFDAKTKKFEQKPEYTWRNTGFMQSDDHPVVNVSWNDAVAFCQWLSKNENQTYRLPTEAEWEYACRAGTTGRFHNGDDPEELVQVANVADGTAKAKFTWWKYTITAKDGVEFTSLVGHYRANAFNLYDMHGNVWEWCSDWYDEDYYGKSPLDNPQGPETASKRICRGGGWLNEPVFCRSADRRKTGPGYCLVNLGFRVAMTPAEK